MRHARQRNKVKVLPILVVLGLILAGAFFGIEHWKKSGGLEQTTEKRERREKKARGVKTVKVAVVTWGGFVGGQYFNEGFEANSESQFYKDYDFEVEFVLEEDPAKSLEMWKNDEIDVHWYTADAFSTLLKDPSIADKYPQIFMQTDWSRGGDMIVATPMVKSVADLKGKQVAVAPNTPSQSLLIKALEANNMTLDDVIIVKANDAIEAGEMFQDGDVDAAVVWDETCINEVRGAKVLTSTKDATHIIADIMFAKGTWIEENPEIVKGLVEGWMKGNAEVNTSSEAKQKAIEILAKGLDQNEDFAKGAIDNVRLATFGDNQNFFKLNGDYKGIDGDDVYSSMGKLYSRLGSAPSNLPKWREIANRDALRDIELSGTKHNAEPIFAFEEATESDKKAEAFASKNVTINFASGASTLNDQAQYVIDEQVANILLTFGGVKVRVEGNTDNVGSRQLNTALSKKRAQAVVDHLVNTYGFDRNKFVVVGNGPDKPVADNNTQAGRAQNRRTEIKFIK